MSESSAENQTVKQKNPKLVWVFVSIIVLLLIAIVTLIFAFVHAQKDDNISGAGSIRGIVTNEQEAKELYEAMKKEPVREGYFLTEMTNDWIFPNGTSPSTNAYVGNAPTNKHPFYFDLILDDTGETIYSSPVLPLGTHVDNIMLDKNLPAGSYRCTMTNHFLDENYIETGSTVNFTISMTVQQ